MQDDFHEQQNSFRDSIATINEKGGRKWIYAKKPLGKYYRWRSRLSWLLMFVFFSLPFIKINGQPLFLLDFFNRRFILFGVYFWPQDSYILFLMMISFIIFIILFTVTYGRLFCGWACPQTIFLEMLFRKIEYWIEGNAAEQKKLKHQNWNFEKIWKKGLKNIIYIVLSWLIINTLISYLLGIDKLKEIILAGTVANRIGFIVMLFFTFAFFIVFSWFREQVCIFVCPYGRLQGVLLDRKSIVVSYDYKRGEPRAPYRQDENRSEAGKGHCVNCLQCVAVCPTGIDIRNGTQLECVNCTACMDACDNVMDRFKLPKRLIRYASEENIAEGKPFRISWRIAAYSIVLTLLLAFLFTLLFTRKPVNATILHTQGQLYQLNADSTVSNLYNIKVINKTRSDVIVKIQAINPVGNVKLLNGEVLTVKAQSSTENIFFLYLDKEKILSKNMEVEFAIFAGDKIIKTKKVAFIGP